MASIYSTQLANSASGVAGTYTVYTVPAATLVVLTNMDLFVNNSAAGQLSRVRIGAVTPANAAVLHFHTSAAAETPTFQWAGRQVLTAGQIITMQFGGTSATWAFTGYALPIF